MRALRSRLRTCIVRARVSNLGYSRVLQGTLGRKRGADCSCVLVHASSVRVTAVSACVLERACTRALYASVPVSIARLKLPTETSNGHFFQRKPSRSHAQTWVE